MDVEMGIAGLLSVALGLGHETLGVIWVLPAVTDEHLPNTPFGPPKMTAATIHATWHIVTVFALSVGALLMTLAWDADADPKVLLLRTFGVMWLVVAAVAIWVGLRRVPHPRDFIRMPVPIFFVVVGVLCWMASA